MAARKRRGVCPLCRRNVAVTWETELVWLHGPPAFRLTTSTEETEHA